MNINNIIDVKFFNVALVNNLLIDKSVIAN